MMPPEELQDALKRIRAAIDAQAEDEGLWFHAQTAAEAYVQQELRKLHGVIESAPRTVTQTEPRPKTARENVCNACQHSRDMHYELSDRAGCAVWVPMSSQPIGEERCICTGFNRVDQ